MSKTFLSAAALGLLALAVPAQAGIPAPAHTSPPANAMPILHEEAYANQEEGRIIQFPIAGIHNSLWYDYRINVTEAQKELASDLKHADDIEDRRDAWEEYADELRHERKHYLKEMAEKGYRQGVVTVE